MRPIDIRERNLAVDVLRGLALAGVLIGNLYALYSGRWARPALGLPPSPDTLLDTIATHVMSVLVEGKAQNLLTFLFGYGFAVQLLRARESHRPVTGLYVRRMLGLFVIGWLHVALLWWGDVTWGYAICGFALLAVGRIPNGVLVALGIALAVAPFGVWLAFEDSWEWTLGLLIDPAQLPRYTRELYAATSGGDYGTLIWNHVRFAFVWSAGIWIWYFPSLIGRFFLGYVAGAQRWFDRDGEDHRTLFRWMLIGGLAIGMPCAAVRVLRHLDVIELPPVAWGPLYMIELLAIAATYVAAVVLLIRRPTWRRVLSIVAPAGRMPLTTYVSQSVAATFVFYGWGLDLDTPGAAACLGIALAIFTVQVVLAHAWLRRFRFGPLEWVWRTIVYAERQPMRR